MSADSGDFEASQLGRHRHQRAIVAFLEQRLHERQREIAAGADHRARDGGAHVGRRVLQQRLQPVERRAAAARLGERGRAGRAHGGVLVFHRLAHQLAGRAARRRDQRGERQRAQTRRRGGIARSLGQRLRAGRFLGQRTPESRSMVIVCSRAAGSPSRSAFAPPVSSQNARRVHLGGAAGRERAQRRDGDRGGLLARERGLDPGERLGAGPLVAVAQQRRRRAGVGHRIGLRPFQPRQREGPDGVARAGVGIARRAQQRLLDPALDEQARQRLGERRLDPPHRALAAQSLVAGEHPAEVRDAVVAEQLRGRRRVAGVSSRTAVRAALSNASTPDFWFDDRVGDAAVPADAEVDLRAQAGLDSEDRWAAAWRRYPR